MFLKLLDKDNLSHAAIDFDQHSLFLNSPDISW